MTGYATAGLAGHLLCEVVPAMYRDTVFRTVEQVLAGGPVKVFDLALTSTSSETLALSVSTSPLRKAVSQPDQTVGACPRALRHHVAGSLAGHGQARQQQRQRDATLGTA